MAAVGLVHLARSGSHPVKLFRRAGGAAASSSRKAFQAKLIQKTVMTAEPRPVKSDALTRLPVQAPQPPRRTKSGSRPGRGSFATT